MNILMIDDDPEDTETFCSALAEVRADAVCSVHHSCPDVSVFVSISPFYDFIFLDAHMEPISGKQCLIELMKVI